MGRGDLADREGGACESTEAAERGRAGGLVELMFGTMDPQIIAFATVAALVTVLPGADMALVARNVLAYGRVAGYLTSIGCCRGLWAHAVASALGVSAILMTSATLFSAVKVVGGLY